MPRRRRTTTTRAPRKQTPRQRCHGSTNWRRAARVGSSRWQTRWQQAVGTATPVEKHVAEGSQPQWLLVQLRCGCTPPHADSAWCVPTPQTLPWRWQRRACARQIYQRTATPDPLEQQTQTATRRCRQGR